MDISQAQDKLKSFWEKKEGKTGMIFVAALVAGGFIGFIKILPWLIALATNTLHLIFLLAAIGAILFLITNPQIRATAYVMFQVVMKKITSWFVKIDPLAILKVEIRDMDRDHDKMGESIKELRQGMQRLTDRISRKSKDLEENMQAASYAKKQGEMGEAYLSAEKASRRKKSVAVLSDLYTRIETMYRVLKKIYDNLTIVIANTKDEIEETEEEYLEIKAAHSAMKSGMSVMYGNKDRRAMYEEAYEALTNDISNKKGEIEEMLDMSQGFMKNLDLQSGMLQEQGLKMLEEWEKKADSWLVSSSTKSNAVNQVSDKQIAYKQLSPSLEEVAEQTNNQFNSLFKK